MRQQKIVLLLLAMVSTSAVVRRETSNEEQIYQALQTLAEIVTVTQNNLPQQNEDPDMMDGAINGLLEQLDPHSSYYDTQRYQTMKEDQKGAFYGVGIIVGYQEESLVVVSPMDGAPAARAGMRAGDQIIAIDAEDTTDMDLYDAIRLLRGSEGSKVTITVRREDVAEPLNFEIFRAEIPSANVRTSFMLEDKTGYVALKDFGETATQEITEAVLQLQKQGLQRLILDLRGNPGGLLPQAIGVAGLFLPEERLVVSIKGRIYSSNQDYYSERRSPIKQVPLIVLIDRGSASASEIVAGALQDHDRALILGVSSWGKGLVQSVFPLSNGTRGLALTTARYYTPTGRNIQGNYDSWEDYYNPVSSEAIYFDQSLHTGKVFTTKHGREVFEVRGITPDVYIGFPKGDATVLKLEAGNRFFKFASSHQDKFGPVNENFLADDRVVDAFIASLDEKDITPFEAVRDVLSEKLTYQFLYIHNTEWAWRHLIRSDNQVLAAQELFPQATRLLDAFTGDGELSLNYTKELRKYATLRRPEGETLK